MLYELLIHIGRRLCVGYIIIIPMHKQFGWWGSLPTTALVCLV